jgi:hypothetical protein
MSNAVVDTDVVSFLFKSHSLAYQYLPDLAGRTLLISFMTVAELDRPRALREVGRGHDGRTVERVPDRLRRRVDRCDRAAV